MTGLVTNQSAVSNAENGGEVMSPDSHDSNNNKNRDSRNSKRSVVFSKSKNPGGTGSVNHSNQWNNQGDMMIGTPSTPQNNNGE